MTCLHGKTIRVRINVAPTVHVIWEDIELVASAISVVAGEAEDSTLSGVVKHQYISDYSIPQSIFMGDNKFL